MKNFKISNRVLASVALAASAAMMPLLPSCEATRQDELLPSPALLEGPALQVPVALEPVARMLSELPLTLDQVREVWDGTAASSENGYDEEYPFKNLLESPGSGVGDVIAETRGTDYPVPLRDMISARSDGQASTRAADFLEELAASDLQIYWPYSANWDGKTIPVVTFAPDSPAECNVGYQRVQLPDGAWIVKEITVDESFAMGHPVWVVNRNTDAGAITPQMLEKQHPEVVQTRSLGDFKTLKLKEFKAHRQYDSWLCGGSEFFIKCGSIKAFTAAVVSDLTLYNPEITDLMIKVKRSQVGKALRYNSIIVSDWSDQLSECAFMMTEDDGGKMTSWKCSGKVTIKSKSYGFDVEIPYHKNDDIVWRGKLSSGYFEKYNGTPCRYGDVSVTFTFD